MIPFFCFRCYRIRTSAEGLRCPQCDRDESGSVMAANFYSAIPEYANSSPGYYVPLEDASTQVSEEDFMQEEPTCETSTQTFEEEFPPLTPTREASTQTIDDDSDCPLQNDGDHGYENYTKADSPFQNKTEQDFDWYTGEDQNRLSANSSHYVVDRQNQDSIAPPFSSCPRGKLSVNKCFQQNRVTANRVAKQKHKTYGNLSRRWCGKCRKCFTTEWKFYAHFKNKCNPRKPFQCVQCDKIFPYIGLLSMHKKTHPSEKPFKCNQCGFASAWSANLKMHVKTHAYFPPTFSSSSRRNSSVSNDFDENLVTENTEALQKSETSSKLSRRNCPKCRSYFMKEARYIAHVESNCHPKPYKCEQCKERFFNMYSLVRHGGVHTREKPFRCTQCNYATKWREDFKRHVKRHTNISPTVPSSSRRNPSLSKSFHENLVTANTEAQQKSQPSSKLSRRNCPKCGRYFQTEATYIAHIRSNCNPNPYKCKECYARFRDMNTLLNHGKVHSQEKPFKCTQCDYASKWPQDLKNHLETHRKK